MLLAEPDHYCKGAALVRFAHVPLHHAWVPILGSANHNIAKPHRVGRDATPNPHDEAGSDGWKRAS